MDDRVDGLKKKMDRLLKEAAEVSVELEHAEGGLVAVLHYSLIEARAHELGRQLSREVQQRRMAETAAGQSAKARCPDCGTRCELAPWKRRVTSIDGSVELQELRGHCPFCERAFFPSAGADGV